MFRAHYSSPESSQSASDLASTLDRQDESLAFVSDGDVRAGNFESEVVGSSVHEDFDQYDYSIASQSDSVRSFGNSAVERALEEVPDSEDDEESVYQVEHNAQSGSVGTSVVSHSDDYEDDGDRHSELSAPHLQNLEVQTIDSTNSEALDVGSPVSSTDLNGLEFVDEVQRRRSVISLESRSEGSRSSPSRTLWASAEQSGPGRPSPAALSIAPQSSPGSEETFDTLSSGELESDIWDLEEDDLEDQYLDEDEVAESLGLDDPLTEAYLWANGLDPEEFWEDQERDARTHRTAPLGAEALDDSLGEGEESELNDENEQPQFSRLHHHHHHHHHHYHHSPSIPRQSPFLQHSSTFGFLPRHLHPGPGQMSLSSQSPGSSPFDDLHLAPIRSASPFAANHASDRNRRMDRSRRPGAQPRDQLVGYSLSSLSGDALGPPLPVNGFAPSSRSAPSNRGSAAPTSAGPAVIDLTMDSDDELPRASQNARRQNSQRRNGSAPRLHRSDSSYINNQTIIEIESDSDPEVRMGELIGSDDDDEVAAIEPPRRLPSMRTRSTEAHSGHSPPAQQRNHAANAVRLPRMGFGPSMHGGRFLGMDDFTILGRPAPVPRINLNYNHLPFPNLDAEGFVMEQAHVPWGPPNRRPQHEPPPAARDGFTRDTNAEDDSVVVCPSCDEELAFDPDNEEEARPTKKPRTKKDLAEHHFWAVRACGHVFCRRCYENRKATPKVKVGFKQEGRKQFCAVEGCDSDVTGKTAWVGIFM